MWLRFLQQKNPCARGNCYREETSRNWRYIHFMNIFTGVLRVFKIKVFVFELNQMFKLEKNQNELIRTHMKLRNGE